MIPCDCTLISISRAHTRKQAIRNPARETRASPWIARRRVDVLPRLSVVIVAVATRRTAAVATAAHPHLSMATAVTAAVATRPTVAVVATHARLAVATAAHAPLAVAIAAAATRPIVADAALRVGIVAAHPTAVGGPQRRNSSTSLGA